MLVVVSALCKCTDAAAQRREYDEEEPVPRKVVRFVSYNDQQKHFKELCEYISLDGRRDAFLPVLQSLMSRDQACSACRQFFVAFTSACRPPKRPKVKKATPTATPEIEDATDDEEEQERPSATPTPMPTRPQVEPHAVVIDYASRLFSDLAAEPGRAEYSFPAVQRLVARLREWKWQSRGEANYFSTLAAYIEATFEEFARTAPAATPPPQRGLSPKGSIEMLFDTDRK